MPTIEPPDERGLALLKVIVAQIRSGEIQKGEPKTFLTSSDALVLLGKPGPWQNAGWALKYNGLASLEEWTSRHDALPKVGALIVYKNSHNPRAGFLESNKLGYNSEGLTWWRQEADRVIGYDWEPWVPMVRYKRVVHEYADLRVHEPAGPNQVGYRQIITLEPGKRGGRPCIRGLRITVGDILGWLAAGMDRAEIIDDFPELTPEDIAAALAFAADRERHVIGVAAEAR